MKDIKDLRKSFDYRRAVELILKESTENDNLYEVVGELAIQELRSAFYYHTGRYLKPLYLQELFVGSSISDESIDLYVTHLHDWLNDDYSKANSSVIWRVTHFVHHWVCSISPAGMHIKLYDLVLAAIPQATIQSYGSTEEEQVVNFYNANKRLFD